MGTIRIGVRAKCKVTGMVGIITGHTEYLNGCVQWLLRPPVGADNKVPDGLWIDDGYLEYVDEGISKPEKSKPIVGGDLPAPTSYRG
jgi:hypothetical protein